MYDMTRLWFLLDLLNFFVLCSKFSLWGFSVVDVKEGLVWFILLELGHVCLLRSFIHSSAVNWWRRFPDIHPHHSPSDLWIPVGVSVLMVWIAVWIGPKLPGMKGQRCRNLIKIRSFHFHIDGLFHRFLKPSILPVFTPLWSFSFICTNMDVFTLQWGLPFRTVTFTCIEKSSDLTLCSPPSSHQN